MQTEYPSNSAHSVDVIYNSSIDSIYLEAWKKTRGIQATFWKALVSIALVVTIALTLTPTLISIITKENANTELLTLLFHLAITIFLLTPLLAGLLMICIKHCTGIPAPISTLFQYFPYWKPLSLYPIVIIGFAYLENFFHGHFVIQAIIIFIGIVWAITYFMTIPLILEKHFSLGSIWEISRKAVIEHWSQVFGFILMMVIILFATLFTLGIGLIWTLPWICNAIAIFYRELFGVQISLV